MMHYLDLLDEMLTAGLTRLGESFRQAQRATVLACQRPDGGFGGRRGGSDLYYTEFALRLLVILDAPPAACEQTAQFLATLPAPHDVVDVFSLLGCRRLLAQRDVALAVDEAACVAEILSREAPEGGLAPHPGGRPTAYATFVGALALSLTSGALARPERAVQAIAALQQPDGGFAQEAGGTAQTNSTSAALGFLLLENALSAEQAERGVAYLAARQDRSGGFEARAGAPPELLSTFTALTTLVFLDGLARLDIPGLARFARACAAGGGGFGAHAGDPELDVEYTYYGIGTLALLAGMLP